MVKGVNKSVIEINNTGDSFVERAILFINPDKTALPGLQLKAKAASYLQSADQSLGGMRFRTKNRLPVWIAAMAASFVSGAGVMYLLIYIFA